MAEVRYTEEGLPFYADEGSPPVLDVFGRPKSTVDGVPYLNGVDQSRAAPDATQPVTNAMERQGLIDKLLLPQTGLSRMLNVIPGAGQIASAMMRIRDPENPDERMQFWPERMLKSAVTLPSDVMSGRLPVTDEEGRTSHGLIERVQDLSGLVMGGNLPAVAARGAARNALGTGPVAKSVGYKAEQVGDGWFAKQSDGPGRIGPFDDQAAAQAWIQGNTTAKAEVGPVFYSGVERAVENAKMNKASPDQWLGYVRNQPGVKGEELGWLGLEDWAKNAKGPVTKEQFLQHVKENKVEPQEVWKRGEPADDLVTDDRHDMAVEHLRNVFEQETADKTWSRSTRERKYEEFAESDRGEEIFNEFLERGFDRDGNAPKYADYQLPGGENYRELLMTLPEKSGLGKSRHQFDGDFENGLLSNVEYETALRKIEGSGDYTSSHWDEPNVLVHVRMNDRSLPRNETPKPITDEQALTAAKEWVNDGGEKWENIGKVRQDAWVEQMKRYHGRKAEEAAATPLKSLHLEEVQSDWHQAGRKQGYNTDVLKDAGEVVQGQGTFSNRYFVRRANGADMIAGPFHDEAAATRWVADNKKPAGVPDAPFKTTWPDLAIKRALREAVDNGYDAVSWTPGEAQAARYDLSKHFEAITVRPTGNGYSINGKKVGSGNNYQEPLALEVPEAKLADYVGKDLAERIVKDKIPKHDNKVYDGLDLKVGGEGMKSFYDKMLVDKFNALAKKHGGKVEHVTDWVEPYMEEAYQVKIPVLKITPQMRQAFRSEGFSLFSGEAPVLVPVEHDPFKEEKAEPKGPKLVPVEHDPFSNAVRKVRDAIVPEPSLRNALATMLNVMPGGLRRPRLGVGTGFRQPNPLEGTAR